MVSTGIIEQRKIFERLLFNIKSYELKQKVFVNGGFQKKFFRETGINIDQSVLAIYNSIKLEGCFVENLTFHNLKI